MWLQHTLQRRHGNVQALRTLIELKRFTRALSQQCNEDRKPCRVPWQGWVSGEPSISDSRINCNIRNFGASELDYRVTDRVRCTPTVARLSLALFMQRIYGPVRIANLLLLGIPSIPGFALLLGVHLPFAGIHQMKSVLVTKEYSGRPCFHKVPSCSHLDCTQDAPHRRTSTAL